MQALGLSKQQAVALLLWVLIERFAYGGLPGALATRIVQSKVQTITEPLKERAMDLSPERDLARLVGIYEG